MNYSNIRQLNILSLTDGWTGRASLLMTVLVVPLVRRLGLDGNIQWRLRLKFHGQKFNFFIGSLVDLAALREVFIKRQYESSLRSKEPVIIDAGAHIGAPSVYFKIMYPKARIIAVEPLARNVELFRKNTEGLAEVEILQIALSSSNSQRIFYIHPTSSIASSLTPRESGQKKVMVDTMTMDELVKRRDLHQVDLIKFDVEGEEYKVFKNFRKMGIVKQMVGEFHTGLTGKSVGDFLGLFRCRKVKVQTVSDDRYIVKIYGWLRRR